MPTTVTESNAFTTSVVVPNDTEAANQASLLLFVQPLANRTDYLNLQLTSGVQLPLFRRGNAAAMTALATPTSNSWFYVDGQGFYRHVNPSSETVDSKFVYTSSVGGAQWVHESFNSLATVLTRAFNNTPYFVSTSWDIGGGGVPTPRLRDLGNSGSILHQPIEADVLPDGATLTGVTLYVDPAAGHGGVPASPPSMSFIKRAISSATDTTVFTQADTTIGSVPAYEARHAITKGSLTEVIDRQTYIYGIQFTSEASTFAQVGLDYYYGIVTYKPKSLFVTP